MDAVVMGGYGCWSPNLLENYLEETKRETAATTTIFQYLTTRTVKVRCLIPSIISLQAIGQMETDRLGKKASLKN